MSFESGERLLVDHSLMVRFVKPHGDDEAVIELGGGTRVIPVALLSRDE